MRENGDSWDINHSVGVTALLVSVGRAIETGREQPIIRDFLSEHFVRSAQHPTLNLDRREQWPPILQAAVVELASSMALRTFAIDEAILHHPAKQLVILASGLDSRPYRLDFPADFTTFEIDRDAVLEFKNSVLTEQNIQAKAGSHHVIKADLREGWIAKLVDAGFDSSQPSIWLTEGLLPYLPIAVQRELSKQITSLAAPGSRWISDFSDEYFSAIFSRTENQGLNELLGVSVSSLFFDLDKAPTREEIFAGWSEKFESLWHISERIGYTPIHYEIDPEIAATQRAALADAYSDLTIDEDHNLPDDPHARALAIMMTHYGISTADLPH